MEPVKIIIPTTGEDFYPITERINEKVQELTHHDPEGILLIYTPHTSCALTINESFDPSAKEDMKNFMIHLAPQNLAFITHTSEGPDDSPSHMKSILLQTSLTLPVHRGKMMLGTWQGIYLCEFRSERKDRTLILKFLAG
jgi:secondary thiamine-phosphate synthase enzyme